MKSECWGYFVKDKNKRKRKRERRKEGGIERRKKGGREEEKQNKKEKEKESDEIMKCRVIGGELSHLHGSKSFSFIRISP